MEIQTTSIANDAMIEQAVSPAFLIHFIVVIGPNDRQHRASQGLAGGVDGFSEFMDCVADGVGRDQPDQVFA